MKQQLTKDRTRFIHDLDGVHIPMGLFDDHYGDIYNFYARAKAVTAGILFPGHDMDGAEILRRGKQSYLETGDGLGFFRDIARERGLDPADIYSKAHKLCHAIAHKQAIETHKDKIGPCSDSVRHFERLKGHVSHTLLTMSCIEEWAKPHMERQTILGYFDNLLGARECNFENKTSSTYPIALALSRAQAKPEQAVFIEDTPSNLRMAKMLDERILTVLVSDSATPDSIPPFVDIHVKRVADFLQMARDALVAKPAPAHRYHQPSYGFGS